MSQNDFAIKNKNVPVEFPCFTSEIAVQAALRAKQIQRRQSDEQDELLQQGDHSFNIMKPSNSGVPLSKPNTNHSTKMVPAIPARANDRAIPPEIPPKRGSFKGPTITDGVIPSLPTTQNRQPPPLPRKPLSGQASAENSQLNINKFIEKTSIELERPDVRRSSNPFTSIINYSTNNFTTHAEKKFTDPKHIVSADISNKPNKLDDLATSNAKSALSPSEDFGSADALRGIESGLRNMERAMQEQLNLRSMEAAATAAAVAAHNNSFELNQTRIFPRSGIYDRHQSLEENRDVAFEDLRVMQLQKQQSHSQNIHQHNSSASSASVSSNASPTHSVEYPPRLPNIEHHMRSLDRNLPLEMQFSRHRQNQPSRIPDASLSPQQQQQRMHRQTGVPLPNSNQRSQADIQMTNQGAGPIPLSADLREQIRQQLLGVVPPMTVVHNTGNTPGSAAAAALLQHQAQSRAVAAAQVVRNAMLANVHLTREELRIRRRSSHDETITTGQELFSAEPGMQ